MNAKVMGIEKQCHRTAHALGQVTQVVNDLAMPENEVFILKAKGAWT